MFNLKKKLVFQIDPSIPKKDSTINMLFATVALLFAALVNADANDTILSIVTSNSDFSVLASLAVKFPAIINALNSSGPITLFAPSNDAFNKTSISNDSVLQEVLSCKTRINYLFHSIQSSLPSYCLLIDHAVAGVAFAPTEGRFFLNSLLPNEAIRVDVTKKDAVIIFHGLNSTKVVKSFNVSNGIVHQVADVLIPPASVGQTASDAGLDALVAALAKVKFVDAVNNLQNVTILAPSDKAFADLTAFAASKNLTITDSILSATLDLHVLQGIHYSTDILAAANGTSVVTALNGTTISVQSSGNDVIFKSASNSAKVVTADVLTKGSVVHVIDTVLLPDLASLSNTTGIVSPSFPSSNNTNGIVTSSTERLAVSGFFLPATMILMLLI